MSGHNKWSQIKRQKGAADAAKGVAFGKLAKRIAVESKAAKGDVSSPTLRAIIEKARELNMPKDKISAAVAKGISTDSGDLEAVTYESYGPGGAAIVIDALTDNRNRTVQEIKHILSKNGLILASAGSAAWAFEKTHEGFEAKTHVPLSEADSDALMKIMDELDNQDDVEAVYTNAE